MTLLPDGDHIARYISPSRHSDGEIHGTAFQLKSSDGGYLSVNWLEFFSSTDRYNQINSLREAFQRKGYSVRKSALFSVLKISGLIDYVAAGSDPTVLLSAHHIPLENDPSHAGISGIPSDDYDMFISQLIAEYANEQESYPAVPL